MTIEQPSFMYDLGNGLFLDAYSLNPEISAEDLDEILSSRDAIREVDLEALAETMPVIAELDSLGGLELEVSDEVYTVPEQLQPFRDILKVQLPNEGQHNGPIMVVKGEVKLPLPLFKAGYFDFKATHLIAVPAERLPGQYPANKTVRELLPEYGLEVDQMARYVGFAHIMRPNNGKEISFVQRAEGLGIAPDCMALSGSTPRFHEDFFKEGFNFQQYFEEHVRKQMDNEYGLGPNEFRIGKSYFIDDKREIPFVAIEIITDLPAKELAKKAHREEHTILYSINPMAVDTLIHRFPIFPSSAYVMNLVAKER